MASVGIISLKEGAGHSRSIYEHGKKSSQAAATAEKLCGTLQSAWFKSITLLCLISCGIIVMAQPASAAYLEFVETLIDWKTTSAEWKSRWFIDVSHQTARLSKFAADSSQGLVTLYWDAPPKVIPIPGSITIKCGARADVMPPKCCHTAEIDAGSPSPYWAWAVEPSNNRNVAWAGWAMTNNKEQRKSSEETVKISPWMGPGSAASTNPPNWFDVKIELDNMVDVVYRYKLNKGTLGGGTTGGGAGGTTGGSTGGSGSGTNDIGGTIGVVYRQLGGANGPLGNVRTQEGNANPSPIGTTGRMRYFTYGQIDLHSTGRFKGQAFAVYGEIGRKYDSLGGTKSRLGFPVANEMNVPTSGTKGRYQPFEDGLMVWHSSGKYNGKTFAIDTGMAKTYNKAGGIGSWLGLPTSDAYRITGALRQVFEFGYMDRLDRDNAIHVYRFK